MISNNQIEAINQQLNDYYEEAISKAVDTVLKNSQLKHDILIEARAELVKTLISSIKSEIHVNFNPRVNQLMVEFSIAERGFNHGRS